VSRWTLQQRIAAALSTVAVLVVVVVAVATVSFLQMTRQQREVIDGYYDALSISNERFVRLIDAENAVRGYALSGDPEALEPFRAAEAPQPPGRGRSDLEELLAGDEGSLAALARARESAASWWSEWAEPTIETVEREGTDALSEAEAARGERLFQRLRQDYSDFIQAVRDARNEAVATLEERMAWLFASVLAVAAVGLAGLGVLAWLLRRWVTAPVTDLARQTRLVRRGALEHPVAVTGPPEIERLGRDVDDMRRALLDEVEVARTANEELGRAKDELEAQAADLERSNRELEQFAYVASHDLQEPLRKVASFTQMLQRRYGGQLDERADQYIEFAVDGAKRMQQLINDLLQFSRVGRITAAQTDVDLDACLDRALRDLETRIDETGATVTRDPLPVVHGEAALLTQVFVNLVGNALKFRTEEPPRIHIGARRDGDVWRVCVRDNGIGIEPQYAERVFVLFQRLHPKEVYAGTGIGLALARKIVEYHGGTIEIVDVHEGPGTTIEMLLPAVEDRPDDGGTSTTVGASSRSRDGVRDDDQHTTPVAAGTTPAGGARAD
jgi:signal transduction histidine kinase